MDRMLWLEIDDKLPLQRLRNELTVRPETFQGEAEPLPMYEESPKWFGVPRAWGMRQRWLTDRYTVFDHTVCPKMAWPAFTGSYRTGQQHSVEAMVDWFQGGAFGGLLEAKTGTGKTVMATIIASLLQTPTLIVIHKEDLADQWKALLRGPLFPGGRVGHVQGDVWDYEDKHMVTAMAQTLYARRDRTPKDFYKQFGLVIYDEGHRYPAKTFEAVMRLPLAKHRMAVSATWRRKDKLECVWNWHIGSVTHRTQGVHLVGEYAQIPWNTSITDSMFKVPYGRRQVQHSTYLTAIAKNAPYNQWLAEQLIEGANAGRQMLLCSHRTDQLLDIRNRIFKSGKTVTVGYYAGKVDGRTIRKPELEVSKTCQIVLATYAKMSEGTDIASLDTLILGTPAVDIEQVVGRIQRPQSDKRPVLVVDPVFQTPYNMRMALKRVAIFQKLGFTKQGV